MGVSSELLDRLAEAEAGSRELDARIWMALNDPEPVNYFAGIGMEMWFDGTPCEVLSTSSGLSAVHELKPPMTPVTTSLDAALALAERTINRRGPIDLSICGSAQVVIHHHDPCGSPLASAFGQTPALALCIAIIKTLEVVR